MSPALSPQPSALLSAQPAASAFKGIRVDLAELIAMRLQAYRFERATRKRVVGSRGAAHASRMRGRGVDYAESRNYQPGDDIRQMDWRVTARTGRPHTKLFQEERERNVLLVVSHNPSMHFGTRVRFKSVQAARLAALIAWAATSNGDRIGAIGYGPGLNAEVKPGGGARGALRVLRALREWDAIAAQGRTVMPLSQALQRAQRLARPGSQVLLIGDGFDCDAASESMLTLLARHCDVAAVLISDRLEHDAPPPARYALHSESGRVQLDFSAPATRAQWTHWFEERRAQWIGQLRKRALGYTMLDTDGEPDAAMRALLQQAARRRSAA
jgi:uncharacterized protein (DUF58 family)